MRSVLLVAGAALGLALAAPAYAQLGGVTQTVRGATGATVGGDLRGASDAAIQARTSRASAQAGASADADVSAGVDRPTVGVPDQARDAARAAAGQARGVVGAAAGAARGIGESVSGAVAGSGSVDAAVGRGSASVGGSLDGAASLAPGLAVRDVAGRQVGEVVRVARTRAGQVRSLVVRTKDGVLRSFPTTGVSVQGDVAVTGYSDAQIGALPKLRR